ncbi:peptidoglycan editing factor PgeF [Peribacillus cavernae]|uniref:Purine nucleoside phosphorylase n=1 Tax=Peribacillus cavernae TaxID=1674310 RepID=A0A433HPZ6_9BACI|nr:peptidoglycan editing factor PgeF [Peribacillus cavernae]MDQ0217162.1 YfiH family protein [Peribacillus cavernae]RUQ30364.1 peptidoglycan editing factor PgeF [Peribacillus cavernae]
MKEPFMLKKEPYFEIESWQSASPGLHAGFTTRNGGTGTAEFDSLNTGFHVGDSLEAVVKNRELLAGHLPFPLQNWVGAEQTHETNIAKIGSGDKGKGSRDYQSGLRATDGLYTGQKGILLTLVFADCVPLYFFAPRNGYIGTAHAGWKGTVAGIGPKMIGRWNEEGISSSEIYAFIGPSICGDCYIVDDKVITLVQNMLEDNDEKPYNLISKGQYQLHLQTLNALLLEKAGVPRSQIEVSSLCTSCVRSQFFSHRRDNGKTGRNMSFIGWKEE